MSGISVGTVWAEDHVTMSVSGDLDYRSDAVLLAAVWEAVQDASVTAIDCDLSELGFCDSSGLGAFIAIRTLTADRGIALTLLDPQTALLRLLDLTGLVTYFAITPVPPQTGPATPTWDRVPPLG